SFCVIDFTKTAFMLHSFIRLSRRDSLAFTNENSDPTKSIVSNINIINKIKFIKVDISKMFPHRDSPPVIFDHDCAILNELYLYDHHLTAKVIIQLSKSPSQLQSPPTVGNYEDDLTTEAVIATTKYN